MRNPPTGLPERPLWLWFDAHRAKTRGAAALAQKQRSRLTQMVAFARANSPFYRDLYREVEGEVRDSSALPVTHKKALMGRFDDWFTDRAVTAREVRAFVDDPRLIGEPFLGKYRVATTSGTTGTPGTFLLDDRSLAVTGALTTRMLGAWLRAGDLVKILAAGGRMTMVVATGGHFASAVAAARLRKGRPQRARMIQVLPAHLPLPELTTRLNQFRPAIVAPYASMALLLAAEQEAGRLHINPVLVALAAEGLPAGEYARIARTFGAKVGNSYAATECPFLSYGCEHRWLHVNSDWAVLEPVDADYRPVPPGTASHTVLLSNLANRVQPILRYDLGDSVLQRPDPCPCGSPLPAIRVQGRTADLLTFPGRNSRPVVIAPLVFSALGDRLPGVDLLQIVQHTPTGLRVRLQPATGADPDRVWEALHAEIARLLASHKLDHVTVERAREAPVQSSGGKYRRVIPLG